ncbi:hypothetical protein COV82_01075 [Candidatus Peregrinibacteria bacterium CG11_big_fil_rev_8_21_14_0_20_46_8]|nr:MAG: hypothetical protein COV82_01075 [Candidatus Peregrinibacteria bacterium CG11_big_fil_rev_8_21_14_0_20_46_8]
MNTLWPTTHPMKEDVSLHLVRAAAPDVTPPSAVVHRMSSTQRDWFGEEISSDKALLERLRRIPCNRRDPAIKALIKHLRGRFEQVQEQEAA